MDDYLQRARHGGVIDLVCLRRQRQARPAELVNHIGKVASRPMA